MTFRNPADRPPVFGDEGKWTKCPEPAAVENGWIKCKKDKCVLKCAEGHMASGAVDNKCEKLDDDTYAFNHDIGTCEPCPDAGCDEEVKPEKPDPVKPVKPTKPPKPTSGECKDFSAILGADSIFTVDCGDAEAAINKTKCAVTCPAGTFFMGKDGKEGTEISCKCKGSKCKWVNSKGKTINGKEVAKWACE